MTRPGLTEMVPPALRPGCVCDLLTEAQRPCYVCRRPRCTCAAMLTGKGGDRCPEHDAPAPVMPLPRQREHADAQPWGEHATVEPLGAPIATGHPPRLADLAREAVRLLDEYDAVRGVAVDVVRRGGRAPGERDRGLVDHGAIDRATWHVRHTLERITRALNAVHAVVGGLWYGNARLAAAGVVEDGWSVELAALAAEQEAHADVRAALPPGETCTDDEAREFLAAEGAKLGEGDPFEEPSPESARRLAGATVADTENETRASEDDHA